MTQVDAHKEFSSHKQKIGWRIRLIPIGSTFEFNLSGNSKEFCKSERSDR